MADWSEREHILIMEVESLRRKVKELERCEEDRRQAEGAIRSRETLFTDLFNATEESAFLMDRDGSFSSQTVTQPASTVCLQTSSAAPQSTSMSPLAASAGAGKR